RSKRRRAGRYRGLSRRTTEERMTNRHTWRRITAATASILACSAALLAPQTAATAATANASTNKTFTGVAAKTVVSATVRPGKAKTLSTKAPRKARAVYLAVHVTGVKKAGTIRIHGVGRTPLARAKVSTKRGVPAARTIFVPV